MDDEFQRSNFRFGRINNSALLAESYRLRYQVYCLERGFLPISSYPCGMERDWYDNEALHFAAIDETGHMAGTIRLVGAHNRHFPLLEKCSLDIDIPANTVEVSRLAVSRGHERQAVNPGGHFVSQITPPIKLKNMDDRRWHSELAIGLYKIIFREAKHQGMQYLLAAMEASLARILVRFQLPFRAIGPVVDYYGKVQPFLLKLSECEQHFSKVMPDMYEDFTHGISHTLLMQNAKLKQTSSTLYEIN